ncbi:hypothetical protein VTL71DRAFT_10685 [Oculimacula yallundae]|uniref:Uncharacterized protein n=1 Tax=Oculimacula yallundae TaxID=86028 RepID=A0ABR4CTT9_9HELO
MPVCHVSSSNAGFEVKKQKRHDRHFRSLSIRPCCRIPTPLNFSHARKIETKESKSRTSSLSSTRELAGVKRQ